MRKIKNKGEEESVSIYLKSSIMIINGYKKIRIFWRV